MRSGTLLSQFLRVFLSTPDVSWGGRVGQWSWVNFQYRGVGPIALAVGAGGGCLDFYSHLSFLFSFSLCLGDGPI